VGELVEDGVEVVEDVVGEELFAQFVPQVFCGVEFRAVGREVEDGDVGRDDEVFGFILENAVEQTSNAKAPRTSVKLADHRMGEAGTLTAFPSKPLSSLGVLASWRWMSLLNCGF
jgi:hypothetical protein